MAVDPADGTEVAGEPARTDHPPSVDALARSLAGTGLPHPLLVDAARAAIERGDAGLAAAEAERRRTGLLQRVINATGVLLHTNLGRAPLGVAQPAGYVNLELDLGGGGRGSRQAHVGGLLARACGAEAALVVNNGAAAVLVVLAALAAGRPTAVSRGELIEIGGGFRIPEIMELSGTRLVEVGTTNRTRAGDYSAVARDAALLLKVHASNYRIEGFTGAATVSELAALGPPVVVDVGSGLLDAGCPWLPDGPPGWLGSEPAVRQALEAGAALVTFSGDKLLGGPQAGVVAGRADLVAACAAHPLYRTVRPGGLVLAALQDVALAYLDRTAHRLPFWRLATTSPDVLRGRAEALATRVGGSRPAPCASVTGGGALPGVEIPSWGVTLPGDRTADLRRARPRPVVARVRHGETVLDLRTVEEDDDHELGSAVQGVLGAGDEVGRG
ncbi:MAG TPA: L-seryl-tRNA(Sec) selenium transferase [Acidimicrobiales bacterium]|nr:L-seryl-tRNA(Sec) selenium transferase [Acidimicrobiales bacterium]